MWGVILLTLFGAFIGYACCVAAGREDERTGQIGKIAAKTGNGCVENSSSNSGENMVYYEQEKRSGGAK